jgi:hypothetical protein
MPFCLPLAHLFVFGFLLINVSSLHPLSLPQVQWSESEFCDPPPSRQGLSALLDYAAVPGLIYHRVDPEDSKGVQINFALRPAMRRFVSDCFEWLDVPQGPWACFSGEQRQERVCIFTHAHMHTHARTHTHAHTHTHTHTCTLTCFFPLAGSPGIGKTVTACIFACMIAAEARNAGKGVLVARFQGASIVLVHVWKTSDDRICFQHATYPLAKATAPLPALPETALTVIGGNRNGVPEQVAWRSHLSETSKKVLFLSSGGLRLSPPPSGPKLHQFTMQPWTEADYRAVLTQHPWWKQRVIAQEGDDETNLSAEDRESDEDLLQAKFYYAGVNARWFFGYSIANVIADIDKYVNSLG